jgi:hypothetical protein
MTSGTSRSPPESGAGGRDRRLSPTPLPGHAAVVMGEAPSTAGDAGAGISRTCAPRVTEVDETEA